MGPMQRSILAIVLILAFVAVGNADIIKSGSIQASSDGISVTIRWITEDESNVASFEIQRAVYDGVWQTIATISPKGIGLYEFVDHTALMKAATVYQYRIQVVAAHGDNPQPSTPVSVSHSVSGVRRTWGSIKSMFR